MDEFGIEDDGEFTDEEEDYDNSAGEPILDDEGDEDDDEGPMVASTSGSGPIIELTGLTTWCVAGAFRAVVAGYMSGLSLPRSALSKGGTFGRVHLLLFHKSSFFMAMTCNLGRDLWRGTCRARVCL